MTCDKSLEDLFYCVNSCGGDTDAIGAMAGAIWGARNGVELILPGLLNSVEGVDVMTELGGGLFEVKFPLRDGDA